MEKLTTSESRPSEELMNLYSEEFDSEELREYLSAGIWNLNLSGGNGSQQLGKLLWLQYFTGLRDLNLASNSMAQYVSLPESLTRLNVDYCRIPNAELYLPNLEHLSMVGAKVSNDYAGIQYLEALKYLDISGTGVQEFGTGVTPALEILRANKCAFRDDWIQPEYSYNLTSLSLIHCDLRKMRGLYAPNLTYLDLGYSLLPANGGLGRIPTLENLDLCGIQGAKQFVASSVSDNYKILSVATHYFTPAWLAGLDLTSIKLLVVLSVHSSDQLGQLPGIHYMTVAELADRRDELDKDIPDPPKNRRYKRPSSEEDYIDEMIKLARASRQHQ